MGVERLDLMYAHVEDTSVPGYEVLQYSYSYLRPRTDVPAPWSVDGSIGAASGDVLSYVRQNPGLTLVAYSPLLHGSYVRPDRPLGPEFEHAGTAPRQAALRSVAAETGATANQVVLAWLMGGEIPVVPLVGASSVTQLEENLAAVDLELSGAAGAVGRGGLSGYLDVEVHT